MKESVINFIKTDNIEIGLLLAYNCSLIMDYLI